MSNTMKVTHSDDEITSAMPALTGTPKQIAWAENLRIEGMREIRGRAKLVAKLAAKKRGPKAEAAPAIVAEAFHLFLSIDDAGRWIDMHQTNMSAAKFISAHLKTAYASRGI